MNADKMINFSICMHNNGNKMIIVGGKKDVN